MQQALKKIFDHNRLWAEELRRSDPDFFTRLSEGQQPDYLWIGCSDSRVPPTRLMNLSPGEVFVHRNIGNLVKNEDKNCIAVVQYAVNVLQVKHIIVCGHYGCGGVAAAMSPEKIPGALGSWIQPIQKMHSLHFEKLNELGEQEAFDRMCELNVLEQTECLARNPIIREAWSRGQKLEIHSWIYCLKEGHLDSLRDPFCCPED